MARTKQTAQDMKRRTQERKQLAAKRQQKVDLIRSQRQSRTDGALKIKRRFRPGESALREIHRYQQGTHNLIQRAPFERVVREIARLVCSLNIRFQSTAVDALQAAAEHYLIQLFEDSQLASLHANRITLMVKDMQLVRRLRGEAGRRYC